MIDGKLIKEDIGKVFKSTRDFIVWSCTDLQVAKHYVIKAGSKILVVHAYTNPERHSPISCLLHDGRLCYWMRIYDYQQRWLDPLVTDDV